MSELKKGDLVMTLPTKWAVEITILQDAERLQMLFPSNDYDLNNTIDYVLKNKRNAVDCMCNSWVWASKYRYKSQGYTILSITELENLLK